MTSDPHEHVLVLIKPDGMHKGLAGEVLIHFLAHDVKLRAVKLVQVSRHQAQEHYGHLKDKPFFPEIVDYLMGTLHEGSPVMAMVFEGPAAVRKCRTVAGATNPEEATTKSVRGKFGRITTKGIFENLVHVSSDTQEAEREINLWFKKSEILK